MDIDPKNPESLQQDILPKSHNFKQMIEESPLGVVILNQETIAYANNQFKHIIGSANPTDLSGRTVKEYIHPSYQKYFVEWLESLSVEHQTNKIEIILQKQDNSLLNVELSASHLKHIESSTILLYVNDITDRKRLETELKYLAKADSLSAFINDNLLKKYIYQAIRSVELNKRHIAVIYLDLDHFNLINETYGYKVGNLLIQAVTERLKKIARHSDIILPLGGDKFVMVLTDLEDTNTVNDLIQKVNNNLSESFCIDNINIFTTATAGISVFPDNGVDGDTIVKNAVLAHYYAKQRGTNNYRYYNPSMSRHIKERAELLYDLRQALNKNQFFLMYQPVIDSSNGRIVGLEALLRWQRSEDQLMLPDDFISVAEESSLIYDIGEWVIEKVCNQNSSWQQQGIAIVPISVNLSNLQFHEKSGLINFIKQTLQETKLSPHLIEFEMSENVTVLDIGSDVLSKLKEMGIKFAISNFGANYFSLNQLRRYHIDTIKIDRSLMKDVPYDADKSAIVSAIIAIGKKLDMNVIGEGVEIDDQLIFLNQHDCYTAQGNLLCRPMLAEELQTRLTIKEKPLEKIES